ncbi:hypothetical protein [Paraburkholderia adhaesiva]|uniref:hypothetical protein n=1 Tax=Paraburkholderia adhaesiva TaxID=2883244 RepID=UPI001F47A16F|nr:hypothetical protein [Paraburkholderia adhaesiva]
MTRADAGHQINLADQVRHAALWPTPVSDDAFARTFEGCNKRSADKLSARVKHWPTPTATLGNKGGVVTPAKARDGGNLIEALALHLWPTPTCDDSRSRSGPYAWGYMPLNLAVRFPTPRANDAEKRGDFDVTNPRNGLPAAVRTWPTPTCQDAENNGGPSQHVRNTKPLNAVVDGPLNPAWVEWLMGWPVGWSDLAPLDAAHFDAWTRQNAPRAARVPDPWFGIDPATRDAHAPGFVPRLTQMKIPHRVSRIRALGNGQVPRVVAQAWAVLRNRDEDGEAANEDARDMRALQLAAGGTQ